MSLSKHSVLSASAAERWMACPGSVRLCAQCPPAPESRYAREGTVAHSVAECAISGKRELWEMMGEPEVTPEMLTHAQTYADHVKFLKGPKGKLWVEKRVRLSSYDKRAFGTSDAIVLSDTTLHVIDYKYGAGHAVEVDENPQLRFYGLGALETLPAKAIEKVETVAIHVVQPRAPHDNGAIRSEWLTRDDLSAWGHFALEPAMRATRAKDAPLVAGDHCRWCNALPFCPEHGHLPAVVGGGAFNSKLPAPRSLTPTQIGLVLESQPIIEEWFKAIYGIAKDRMEHGEEVPGWKLVEGRRNKKWKDEEEAARLLGDKAYAMKLISPAQALKLGFDATPHFVEVIGERSIAPIASKRKQVEAITATDVFDEV